MALATAFAWDRAAAQPLAGPALGQGPPLAPACSDGLVHDDGTVETGYGWIPSVVEGVYVQQVAAVELGSTRLLRACVCWLRTGPDDVLDFELVVYADDGSGQPELQPLAAIPAVATGVPAGITGAFYEVPTPGLRVPASGSIYVGVRWDPSRDPFFFLCADHTAATPFTDVFFMDDRASGWGHAAATSDPIFSGHRAAMVRPVAAAPTAPEVPTLGLFGALAFVAALLAVALRSLGRA